MSTILLSVSKCLNFFVLDTIHQGFSGGSDGKESVCNVGDSPLQYSCLENSMDRGAWWARVHGVAELDTTEGLIHFHVKTTFYLFQCI